MNRSLLVLWLVLICAIGSLTAFAQFWIVQRRAGTEQRVRTILQTQLEPLNAAIARVVDDYSVTLQSELPLHELADASQCVELTRHPLADFVTVLDPDGKLSFPERFSGSSSDRRSLTNEAQQLLMEQADLAPASNAPLATEEKLAVQVAQSEQSDSAYRQLRGRSYGGTTNAVQPLPPAKKNVDSAGAGPAQKGPTQTIEPAIAPPPAESESTGNGGLDEFGWMTWYHRRGMVLGFWWVQANDYRCLIGLPRARWMADIVANLPDSQPQPKSLARSNKRGSAISNTFSGHIKQLIDVEGNVIYQWGDAPPQFWSWLEEANKDAMTLTDRPGLSAEVPVVNPLEGWRLRVHATEELVDQLGGDDMIMPIWLAVAGLSSALLIGGWMVTLNLNRQLRLAEQRVSFVNQVSHELRTPLTNICMYADLLAKDLELEEDEEAGIDSPVADSLPGTPNSATPNSVSRLNVIRNESHRLSRLISNVLEFARAGSKSKPLRLRPCVLNEILLDVLQTFKPRLDELGFEVSTELNTPQPRQIDPDGVEQILINLISNAEKYAVGGQALELKTWAEGDRVFLSVKDDGPGVPPAMASKIFSPFERASERLEDPAGTGIGLTIVREISRRHGGDCRLIDDGDEKAGAHFMCWLDAPRAPMAPLSDTKDSV